MSANGADSQQHISELMDIVDDNDVVIGTMPRKQAYAENMRKRIIYVFVVNPHTHDIALAVRAQNVSWRPLHYAATAGGHVMAGETAEQAAMREMHEEIGVQAPVHLLDKSAITDPTNEQKFIDHVYVAFATPEHIVVDPQEVDRVEFMSLNAAQQFIANRDVLIHPNLPVQLNILQNHWSRVVDLIAKP